MQPRVTVALATVWLTVGLVGGTVTLRLPHDQYFPASPRHPSGVQRDQTENSRDHNSAEDQPLDLWIGSRRSISSAEESPSDAKFAERDFPLDEPLRDIVSSKQVYPLSSWQERLPSIADAEFAADKVDYGEMPETLPRVAAVPPSDFSDDPFVADDTFQDQGPGSVEIYKLDLSKEKALLTATTPSVNSSLRNKGKAPKKTGRLDATKTKVTDVKLPTTTTESKIHHRQSNFFDEQRTETPTVNRDVAFGVGGVPELQVGCEGLEASSSFSHKAKRSIDTTEARMRKEQETPASALVDMTPVSLDFDYDLSTYDEADFEEMDELLKLKRLETTTRINRPNRGDMDASHLNSDHLDESRRSEKLPVRGDLGRTSAKNSDDERIKAKRGPAAWIDDGAGVKQGRRLLWIATANTSGFADVESERKRAKRSTHWGYGENEGVVSSNELQTVNQRRRQHDMRHYEDVSGRKQPIRETDLAIEDIRRQYEQMLRQKEEIEERQRRRMQQQDNRRNRWEEGKSWKNNEMRRRLQEEEYRRKMAHDASTPRTDDEQMRRRQMEEQRRQEEAARNRTQEMARRNELEERRREEEEMERRRRLQELRRRYPQNRHTAANASGPGYPRTPALTDAERRRKQYDEEMEKRRAEEARRQDQYRSQQETQRRKEAEERQRQEDSARKLSEDDRRRLEERRREWAEKRRQEEEHERRRQQPPSNLISAGHRVVDYRPNDVRQSRDRDEERRIREQKLREYIARNRPINAVRRLHEEQDKRRMDASTRVSQDEEYHRRLAEQRRRNEEERKLQDYLRRNQPVNLVKSNATGRDLLEERRQIEEARRRGTYPDPGARRHHGPSASTYINPRGLLEEVRRRQEAVRRLEEKKRLEEKRRKALASRRQYEQEEEKRREEWMRKEAARREEEATQSRRYEQDRKRQEAASLQAERQRQEMLRKRSRIEAGRTMRPEATRPTYQDPRLFEEHRRRQESRPIPSNLTLNQAEARRTMAERKMQEADRRRAEENRMRDYKWKETNQWKQQELTRLNSLPVSARIIVRSGDSSSGVSIPPVISRMNFDNEINFSGINPNRQGVPAHKFPAPPTSRPPAKSPGPCVWAVVHCCSSNNNRRLNCFESMGCPGSNWDPNPCRNDIMRAARERVMEFYAEAENQQ